MMICLDLAEMERLFQELDENKVVSALRKMKNGEAVGPDHLPVEVWKCLGSVGVEYFKQELNNIMVEERSQICHRKVN